MAAQSRGQLNQMEENRSQMEGEHQALGLIVFQDQCVK